MYGEIKVITLSTGKKIYLEELNCLLSTTTAEIEELLLILKSKRTEREIKTPKVIPPIYIGHCDY